MIYNIGVIIIMENQEISKVKLPSGEIYNIKDELLRHQMNVLLGIETLKEFENFLQIFTLNN